MDYSCSRERSGRRAASTNGYLAREESARMATIGLPPGDGDRPARGEFVETATWIRVLLCTYVLRNEEHHQDVD